MVVIAGEARLLSLRRRDAQAEIDNLYRRHADEVLRYVQLVLRSRPDAEDVVQATFIRAFRALERGERVQKPRNWLVKIAHNECRRALQVRSRRSVEVELQEVACEPAGAGQAEELRRAMSQLATKQREALVLRELEGRSYAEIAATLELSESAVETLIFRARRALREQLEETLACDEAATLLAAETIAPPERKRLRGHLRGCAECSALERQARGRKSALKRLASSFGLPWLGKVAAVALTVSTVAVVAAPAEHAPAVGHDVVPQHVDKAAPTAPAAVPRTLVAPVRPHRAAKHRPAAPAKRAAQAATVAGTAVPAPLRLQGPAQPAAAPPTEAPAAAAPSPTSAEAPAAPAPAAATPPPAHPTVLAVPPVEVQAPQVAVPVVDVPQVDVPHVEVPPVVVPPVTVTVPVPTPQVPALPSVP